MYVLEQATGQGHTCLPMDQLMQEARRLLGVEIDSMNDRIMDLIMDKKIVVKTKEDIQMVYSSVSYYTELTIAQMLKDLNIKDTRRKHIRRFTARRLTRQTPRRWRGSSAVTGWR